VYVNCFFILKQGQ